MNYSSLESYFKTKFKKDIVIDSIHSTNYIKQSCVDVEKLSFTIHVPYEQLKSWHEVKQTVASSYSYVQLLNVFVGKSYPTRIKENCSRIENLLRVSCSKAAKQLAGTSGRKRENLLDKVKSIAVLQDELLTVSSICHLESEVSRLEKENGLMRIQNVILDIKHQQASTLATRLEAKLDQASTDIEKLKEDNRSLYDVIQSISPQAHFEDKGKNIAEVGKRQQERKLKTLKTKVEQVLWFSESYGLHLDKVNFVDNCGKPYSLLFGEKTGKSYKELPVEEQQKVEQILYIMDKFCIGEATYHELTCCLGGKNLPRSYLIKECKEDINKLIYIERTPGEPNGAALNFCDELRCVIEKMVSLYLFNFALLSLLCYKICIISKYSKQSYHYIIDGCAIKT